MKQSKIKIIISGGGTGGHIFPAIAIANALKNKIADVDILFVGAQGKMEMEKVPAAGYKIVGLWISGFQRRLTIKNLSFPFKLISSLCKAKKIIKEFKPDVAIGVGGFASGPLLKAATRKKIPSLIQEQNSYPGVTNKLLAKHVNKICVAYDGMEKYFPKEKIYVTGNPVRHDITSLEGKRERALEFFNLSGMKKTILVIGGSLGARTINESIAKDVNVFKENNIQLIWQTGKAFYLVAKEKVQDDSDGIRVFDFITKMDYAYSVADIIISRAGAISISELCMVRKPAILVPSPNVAEDHQTKNAQVLVNHKAAIMIKDVEANEKLVSSAMELIKDEEMQIRLKENIAGMAFSDAADNIAGVVLSLIKK
jgi:UDP-N-acetylglucosamine--N-acetylmuramyl-(pentapeptide) pyrophosphoryl-undecaprenol N-acetylglucosamine transferase